MQETEKESRHDLCVCQPVLRGGGSGRMIGFGITICDKVKQKCVMYVDGSISTPANILGRQVEIDFDASRPLLPGSHSQRRHPCEY
jgi:hypothetical protein